MTRIRSRVLVGMGCLLAGWSLVTAQQGQPDLSEYRTVEKAITTRISLAPAGRTGQTGYLGVSLQRDGKGRLVVEEVQPDSPADKAGVQKGDVISRAGEQSFKAPEAFREWLQTRGPGETVKLALLRDDKPVEATATLAATSRPMSTGGGSDRQRVFLGVQLGEPKEGEHVRIEGVAAQSPAELGGLKTGDQIVKVEGKELPKVAALGEVLGGKKPGDVLTFLVRRDGKDVELKVTLGTERGGGGRPPGSREGGSLALWKKDVFRLAVVCIEFPDVKHNDKIPLKEWDDAFFSRKGYRERKNPTGEQVHGSLNEWLHEQSGGAFRIEGKVFEWVEVSKKRADYSQGSGTSNKTALLVEALEKVTGRDDKDAFKDFDGFLFLYAGEAVRTNRGALYSPHAGIVSFQSNRQPYVLGVEGGSKMTSISGFAKEFCLALGLPELAARTENVGSEGAGAWCVTSNPLGNGRPQHLSAWSKGKLGWVKPAVIDPSVKQKLILSPIEDSPKECFKVLVRPDGSEYFLLENRRKKGFDADLPGEGLLVWRVVNDRPILEESHGIEGPAGPTSQLSAVPFPSPANSSFTPDTTPSSRSPLGGGLTVRLTEIRRLPDGRITFHIGYDYR